MKRFVEVLHDGFTHEANITDPELIATLRHEGVTIDQDGIYIFSFGDHKEFQLTIEPLASDNHYQVGLYKDHVPINLKLPIWVPE